MMMEKRNGINLEYYKVFACVCRTGSITTAAEELCISQPAVSQAVKQLEDGLGCRLFYRTSKGARPTAEGEALYSYVKRGLSLVYEGEDMIRRIKDLETGEIRIGASDMTLQFFLLPYLEEFHEEYPGVKVNVSNGPTPETLEFLYEGKIDFGIISTPFDARPDVECTQVKQVENIFIAGEKYRKALGGKKLSYEVLTGYPCIFLEKKTSTRRFMDQYLAGLGVVLEPEFELATSDMIVQFAKRNLGVGCLMSEFAEEAIASGEVFRLEFEKEMPKRSFCLVTERRRHMSPAAGKLLNKISRGYVEYK